MNPGKAVGIVKTISDVATSKDPAKAAGAAVAGALTVAHPIIGAAAAPLVARGTEKLVNKGIQIAKDPKTKEAVKQIGVSAGRGARMLGAAGARKLNEFRGQIGRK